MAEPGGRYRVEDLTVRLASSSMQGVVLDAEGEPLAGAPFGARSANFRITPREPRLELFPRTGPGGEFNLPQMLPDERLSFWVVLSENTAHIWQGLEPGGADIRLSLADGMRVDLPPDWLRMGGLEARALRNTRVEGDVVNFELPDLEGNMVSLDDPRFANKVLLVNIWGSWCGHCRREIPHLIELKKKYGARGLEIIGIAFEEGEPAERRRAVERFAERLQMNYPILLGGIHEKGSVESVLVGLQDFRGFPATLFIERGGTVEHVQVGFVGGTPERLAWQLRRTEERIERLLR
ncbi:MAG: TlpA family protein disulfide reductase [Candidatus Marinimicrobia bacterium]|nr:TlpA family protein disulfide reductase [Candidatus Neomarinimicrobiota bacterium]